MTEDQNETDQGTVLKISTGQQENRFSRFELIRWWDQSCLKNARVLVIGAGALGNEIIKNLALVGIGNILLVDFDQIEPSNLSRSVLFRESDRGRNKADVAAERARELFPEINIRPLCVNAVTDLGLGVFYWADVILGGLDNREARLAINQNAFRSGKSWIDGAIEGLSGVARFCTRWPLLRMYDERSRLENSQRQKVVYSTDPRRDDVGQNPHYTDHCQYHCRCSMPGSHQNAAWARNHFRSGIHF